MDTKKTKKSKVRKRNKNRNFRSIVLLILATIITTLIVTLVTQQYLASLSEDKKSINNSSVDLDKSISEPSWPATSASNIEEDAAYKENKVSKQDEDIIRDGIKEELDDASNNNESTLALYYIRVIDEKNFEPVRVLKTVPFTLSILQASLKKLLQKDELAEGLRSFIPADSKINNLKIENRVAYIDFNEAFQFNEYGSLGTLAQLHQVVLTCIEFSNIDKVQILINSERKTFLAGDEGLIMVNQALTKSYLQNTLSSLQ